MFNETENRFCAMNTIFIEFISVGLQQRTYSDDINSIDFKINIFPSVCVLDHRSLAYLEIVFLSRTITASVPGGSASFPIFHLQMWKLVCLLCPHTHPVRFNFSFTNMSHPVSISRSDYRVPPEIFLIGLVDSKTLFCVYALLSGA